MLLFLTVSEGVPDRDRRIDELILKMARGDVSAMGELYELIKGSVYGYALSKTRDKDLAEDITHDTFVRIYKYASHYKPSGKPMAWIISVEINIIRRHFNTSKRIVLVEDVEREPDEGGIDAMINNELIRDLLRHLKEDEREIVVLHAVTGLKHREIAKLLDLPLSTVLSKYNRAIKKLQALVKERGDLYE